MILIEKDKAIKETWEEPSYSDPLNVLTEIRDRLNTLPTIEIVRCKDCKYHEDEDPGMVYCPNRVGGWVSEDFFCKDGKRRDENE